MFLTGLDRLCRNAGVDYTIDAGARNRSLYRAGLSGVRALMVHTTESANSAFASGRDAPTLNFVRTAGGAGYPSYNILVGRSGKLYIVAMGASAHAGYGITSGIPRDQGNRWSFAISMDANNAGYPVTSAQLEAVAKFGRACLNEWGSGLSIVMHGEYAPARRSDPTRVPGGWSALKTAIARGRWGAGSSTPVPSPTVPVPPTRGMANPLRGTVSAEHHTDGGYKGHGGRDIVPAFVNGTKPRGAPVYAAFTGTVKEIVRWAQPGNRSSTWAVGRTGNGMLVANVGPGSSGDGEGNGYNHMAPLASLREGDVVVMGQHIGHLDSSGNQITSRPDGNAQHLHFEMWTRWTNPGSHYSPKIVYTKYGVNTTDAVKTVDPVPTPGGGAGGPAAHPAALGDGSSSWPVSELKHKGAATKHTTDSHNAWVQLLTDVGYDERTLSLMFQRWLNQVKDPDGRSYYTGRIDGQFGTMSVSALQRFLFDRGWGSGNHDGVRDGWVVKAEFDYLNSQREYYSSADIDPAPDHDHGDPETKPSTQKEWSEMATRQEIKDAVTEALNEYRVNYWSHTSQEVTEPTLREAVRYISLGQSRLRDEVAEKGDG